MTLLFGQPIDARELEQATSQWSPERFASMCNDLVWAVSGRQYPGLPSLTERVNSADSGIDAEWELEVADGDRVLPTPIVGPGWNVFQYKKRDLIAQDRRRIIADVKSSLKGTLRTLAEERGKTPDRYILFLNVDLKHDQTLALRNAILEGQNRTSDIHVEVIGAAEIAALLNDQPHLRAAYFTPLSFKTWEESKRHHLTQKLFSLSISFTGRDTEVERLRSFLDDSLVGAVIVTGPHDIGKSRLVIEATKHHAQDVVFAADPRSMKVHDYRKLVGGKRPVMCVIEDPEPDNLESLVNEILGVEGLKVIITLPTPERVPVVSYGRDSRVQSLSLGPLSDEDSRKLLRAANHSLDFAVESWILERAGGNPGILLTAASVGEGLRADSAEFTDAVGRQFEKRIQSELGQDALACTELVSILTHVGIRGSFESELKMICQVFSDKGLEPPKVLSMLERLEEAGLVRRGGSFTEISVPLLSNYLSAKLLRGRTNELFALFGKLSEPARIRFLRRLSQLRAEDVDQFWSALFGPAGLFGNLRSALEAPHMFRLVAGTVPERAIEIIESGLVSKSYEERIKVSGEERRELMWALEELLFRKQTTVRALRCLALLAEAENENYGNNATAVFCESFHPFHPQLPLPLHERFAFLKSLFSSENSVELQLLGVKAIRTALSRTGAVMLRRSNGPEPLDSRPAMTCGEAWDYIEKLIDFLMVAAKSDQPALAEAASAELPQAIAEYSIQGRPAAGVALFKTATGWVRDQVVPIPVADLVDSLRFVKKVFAESNTKTAQEAESNLGKCVEEIDALISSLETGNFATRLKIWASKWTHDEYETQEGVGRIYRGEKELQLLAKEAVSRPEFVTEDVLRWLCSEEALRATGFFFWLGKEDLARAWLSRIQEIAVHNVGAAAFAAYCAGLSKNDRAFVNQLLDELTQTQKVSAEAILLATRNMSGELAGIVRIESLIKNGSVDPVRVERVLVYSGWIDPLDSEEYLRLLKAIAGETFHHAAAAIHFLGNWLHNEREIERQLAEFAWKSLEAASRITRNDSYYFDQVASKLAAIDLKRGFRLLETLLKQPYETKSWNPIDPYGGLKHEFWNVLYKADRQRALRTVFLIADRDPVRRFRATWDLSDLLDQEGDADFLIEYAFELEDQALLVAESITTAKPGFWRIASSIVQRYPNSSKIQAALTSGIEQMGKVIDGPMSVHLDSRRKEVERVLNDPATPPAVRGWLREVLGRMEGEIAQHVIWEYDEDVNDLRRYIEDRGSHERLWAISRVLKYAEWKDIRRMLTVEDIEEALPQVDLPENKRRALEKALEVWRLGS